MLIHPVVAVYALQLIFVLRLYSTLQHYSASSIVNNRVY